MSKLLAKLLILIFSLLTIGMSPVLATDRAIQITAIDYLIENIHPSYWDGEIDPDAARLYFNIYIYINDLEKNFDLLQEVRVYDMYENYWTVDLSEQVDFDSGYLGGLLYWYDKVLTNNSTLLTIKDLIIRITTTDGRTIEYPFSLAEPGAAEPSEKKFVFAEPYRGRISEFHIPALKMGAITSAALNQEQIVVEFTIDDPRVMNGYFQFFDKNEQFIGESSHFINAYSGEFLASLNNGSILYLNNEENCITLPLDEINFTNGQSAADIHYIQLLLTDGGQFAKTNDPTNFYYASRSEMILISNNSPPPQTMPLDQSN